MHTTLNQHTPHDSLVCTIKFYTINFVSWSESCYTDILQVSGSGRRIFAETSSVYDGNLVLVQPTVVDWKFLDNSSQSDLWPTKQIWDIQYIGVLVSSYEPFTLITQKNPFWHPTFPGISIQPSNPRNEATCGMHCLRWNNGILKIR